MHAGASPDTAGRAQPPALPVPVPPGGLTSAEAVSRLGRDGENVLPAARPVRLWRRVAAQVRDPLVLVLLAAAAAALSLQLAGLYLPFLRDLLHTQPLTLADLAAVFALSTLGYAAVRLDRLLHRGKGANMMGAVVGGRS